MINRILHRLYIVVGVRAPIIVALVHNRVHIAGGLAFREIRLEFGAHRLNGPRPKTRQPCVKKQADQGANLLAVRTYGQIALDTQLGEPLKRGRAQLFAHDKSHLGSDLHVGLKSHVSTGRRLDHKTEVDVYDVAIFVQHEIT